MPTGVYKRTKEHRRSMSEARKGTHLSEETKKKLSAIHKGTHLSEDTKKKLSKIHKGIRLSEATKKKLSKALKGKKKPQFSKEWRRNISKARRGTHPSEATRHKMSVSGKKRIGEKNGFFGKHHSEKAKRHMRLRQIGEKNHNWKGGITPLKNIIRKCFKYRQWRSDIFTRDGFTCVLCGKRYGQLEADHYPKKFSEILKEYNIKTLQEALYCEELWNINNGRTLCKDCHRGMK